ncbi:MAG: InlB B-repeat-containing protein [Clostridia bacterium]|nr:InlB B-repeat-containing protein [Clostridia bacterium]
MKKIITTILLCCLALLVVCGMTSCGSECEHIYDDCADTECNECGETRDSMHSWNEADCVSPKTCKVCNATEGDALGHEWTTPDVDLCKIQSTCSRCGATDGENAEHTWVAASCENAKSCTECGATDGFPLGHIPNADDGNCLTAITCQRCPEIMTEAQSSHTRGADDGSCETSIKCTVCDFIIVPAKSHDFTGDFENDAEGHWHECQNEGCSVTDEKSIHSGDAATCMQGAICTNCGLEYTEKDTNNHASDKYTYISNGDTTHKKIHECNAITSEDAHVVDTSKEISYTWSNDYSSCTATGFCSLCEASVAETVSSTDEERRVSVAFTIVGFEKRYFYKTTISFNTDGGSDIAPITQLAGTKVTPPANPTKPGYIFTGWNKEIPTTMPSGNVTITARWEPAIYTVIWQDENGDVLELDEGLSYGETPEYNGKMPYKSSTAEYSYLFESWSPSVGPVTKDTTYTAVYEEIKIEELEGCTYKKGDVVECQSFQITYCPSCGKLIMKFTVTITGLRGFLDGTPVYWVTYHCCGHKTSETETAIIGKK